MRYFIGGESDEEEVVGGRMWSRMYCVKGERMELLFWKKEPAGLVNLYESMYSVDVAFESVMQVLRSVWVGVVVRMLSSGKGVGMASVDE